MFVTGLRHVGKGTWSIPWLTLPMHPYVWDYSWPFLRQENALVAISEDALCSLLSLQTPVSVPCLQWCSLFFLVISLTRPHVTTRENASLSLNTALRIAFYSYSSIVLVIPYVYNFLPQRKGVIYLFFPPFGLQAALFYPSRYSRHFGKLLKIWKVSFVQSQL